MMMGDEKIEAGQFRKHLREAIAINQSRRSYYAECTEGRSRKLSNRLILSERMCIPVALYFDKKAKPFNDQGIAVVAGDFVAMDNILAQETAPRYRGLASSADLSQCKAVLGEYGRQVCGAAKRLEFAKICDLTVEALHFFAARERAVEAHFTMSKHVLESVGLAALNAMRWAEQSDGATLGLSKQLVYVQARPISSFLLFDQWAQALHQEGCAILVNDIPPIPFEERMASKSSGVHR